MAVTLSIIAFHVGDRLPTPQRAPTVEKLFLLSFRLPDIEMWICNEPGILKQPLARVA
jgi:hypothetical protein